MLKKFTAAAATLALVGGLGLWSASAQTPTAETPAATAAAIDPATIADYGIGDINAKVQIKEYASYTCPHCATFHEEVYPKLKAEYIDTGKVRLTYHEVYFDRYGLWAGMMARCGGEMRYIGIIDTLYSTQRDGPPRMIRMLSSKT